MGLRHDQVLVVAVIRDQRALPLGLGRALGDPRQVVAVEVDVGAGAVDRRGEAHPQLQLVRRVEAVVVPVVGPAPVHRVQVQGRRPALQQLVDRDVLAERPRRVVQGQVVVDELAQIGEAGRNRRIRGLRLGRRRRGCRGHRRGDLLEDRGVDRPALGQQPGEPELAQGRLGRRPLADPALAVRGQDSLADDVIVLAHVTFHDCAHLSPETQPPPPARGGAGGEDASPSAASREAEPGGDAPDTSDGRCRVADAGGGALSGTAKRSETSRAPGPDARAPTSR